MYHLAHSLILGLKTYSLEDVFFQQYFGWIWRPLGKRGKWGVGCGAAAGATAGAPPEARGAVIWWVGMEWGGAKFGLGL